MQVRASPAPPPCPRGAWRVILNVQGSKKPSFWIADNLHLRDADKGCVCRSLLACLLFFKIHFERDRDSLSRGGTERGRGRGGEGQRERETKKERERERERERESQAGSTLSAQSLRRGLNSQNSGITTGAENKSQTLNRLSHPGSLEKSTF